MSFTPVTLDKVRNFRYGMKAIHMLEKALGQKVAVIDMENLSMEETATVIWAGLVHEDNELTTDKVMDLIDNHSDIPTVVGAMAKAFAEAFNGGEQADPNEQTATERIAAKNSV